MLGGMSWESTLTYYQLINEGIKSRAGGFHSAPILLYSFDFADIEACQHRNDWTGLQVLLAGQAKKLENAGADFILLCTNTMHKIADGIQAAVAIPLLHIADAVGKVIVQMGFQKVSLLGTNFTMEGDFYRKRLADKFDLQTLIPVEADRNYIHRVIYEELCLGSLKDGSRRNFVRIIEDLSSSGAEGVILGCTEIPLLIKATDISVPLFDSTAVHAAAAVDMLMCGTDE